MGTSFLIKVTPRTNPESTHSRIKMAFIATIGAAVASSALSLVGFTSAGVAACSIAAGIQSGIGAVAVGSTFAVAQSAGAAGVSAVTAYVVGGGATLATGAGVAAIIRRIL